MESDQGRDLPRARRVIAIDTNLLVYAHRPEMPFHERAREVLTGALAGAEPVSVPWPCAHEFLAIVSNPRIFRDPKVGFLGHTRFWSHTTVGNPVDGGAISALLAVGSRSRVSGDLMGPVCVATSPRTPSALPAAVGFVTLAGRLASPVPRLVSRFKGYKSVARCANFLAV